MRCRPIPPLFFPGLLLAFLCASCGGDLQSSESARKSAAEPAPQSAGGQGTGNADSGRAGSPVTPNSPPSPGPSAGEGESDRDDTGTTEDNERPNWYQLSTDDSTSMASAQMFKANFGGRSLKAHEFINYYDPPSALRAQENWAVDTQLGGIHYAFKTVYYQDEVPVECDKPTPEEVTPEEGPAEGNQDAEEGESPPSAPVVSDPPVPTEDCETTETRQIAEVLFHMNAPQVPRETRRNWNLFLCVDVSGSMSGSKMSFTREALAKMLGHLKPNDKVTLVTFDSNAHTVFSDLEFSANEQAISQAFSELSAGSATNMIAGLERTYELAQSNFDETMLQRVILFSDGNANVGETAIETFSGLTRINGQEGIYLSGVGVGTDYDWERMDRLTDAGKGAHVFLPNRNEVDLIFGDYFTKLVEVAADRIAIELTLPPGIHLESFSGEEVSQNPEERLQNIVLAAGDDITFLARFVVEREAALNEAATLTLKFRPLSTNVELEEEITIAHFNDLIKEPGEFFKRTRLINDFAKLATNTRGRRVTQADLAADLAAQDSPDWGLLEIQSLLQTHF
ncbi:MAG: VWA domain-containing protein [Myxococcota bacterium]|nr:VWA domain-containing protein [Myxococcota bacterium]